MKTFGSYFLILVKITVLTCVGILCAAVIYHVFDLATSTSTLVSASRSVGLSSFASYIYDSRISVNADEIYTSQVTPHHDSIVARVLDCMRVEDKYNLPSYIFQFISLPNYRGRIANDKPLEGSSRPPNREERAIVQLSKELASQRIVLQSKAQEAYSLWQVTSLITIALGMLTTIFVAMSSTEFGRGDGRSQRVIRVLAIVFPALGTAAAAAITFYAPQAEWSQASRTLASLTQLHGQMALGVWNLGCIQGNDEQSVKLSTAALDGWSRRYLDIQTVAAATGQANVGKDGSGTVGQGTTSAPTTK
jgi:hypothetical protein